MTDAERLAQRVQDAADARERRVPAFSYPAAVRDRAARLAVAWLAAAESEGLTLRDIDFGSNLAVDALDAIHMASPCPAR